MASCNADAAAPSSDVGNSVEELLAWVYHAVSQDQGLQSVIQWSGFEMVGV